MSRIRTQVQLGAEVVEIDVHASFGHDIDLADEDMVTAALAVNHHMLLDLVRAALRERGVDPDQRTVEILDAHRVASDAPPPRPALSIVPEGWTATDVKIRETTTYTVTVAHPTGATSAEIAAVGYGDYCLELHPDSVFAHEVGADEITVVGGVQGGDGQDEAPPWPSWADRRPALTRNTAEPQRPLRG